MKNGLKAAFAFAIGDSNLWHELPPNEQIKDEIEVCREREMPYFLMPLPLLDNSTFDGIKIVKEVHVQEFGGAMDYYEKEPVQSLKGYHVLPRSFLRRVPLIIKAISNLGGENALTEADIEISEKWPLYVKSDAIKRRVEIVKASELHSAAEDLCVDGKVFAKTVHLENKPYGGHGTVAEIGDVLRTLDKGLPYRLGDKLSDEIGYMDVGPDTELILSQPISLENDSLGTKEYRVWVVGDEATAIVRYSRPDVSEVPETVYSFAKQFTREHSGKLPRHYVADIGLACDMGPLLIELNHTISTGNTTKVIFTRIMQAYKNFVE